jgi:hypothetical protein
VNHDAGGNGMPAASRTDIGALIDELRVLRVLREAMLEFEARLVPRQPGLAADGEASARNLAHFLAMRSFDLRAAGALANWLSSLGRASSASQPGQGAGPAADARRRVAPRVQASMRAARAPCRGAVRCQPGRSACAHHGDPAGRRGDRR